MSEVLKAPFPWFGGKSTVAHVVWSRLGNVQNYVEPFFGSGVVLLLRPLPFSGPETVNDKDGFVSNFWRAVSKDSQAVAEYADWPVNENDLHARHSWLVGQKQELVVRLEGDPDYYDAKIAGWWCWGMCVWIGSEFCSGKGPWHSVDGKLVNTNSDREGIWRQRPHLGDQGRGVNRQLPYLGGHGQGVGVQRNIDIYSWFARLQERLSRVRVCSGDWSRVMGPSVTTVHGLTGVFLDPPYSSPDRDQEIYTSECTKVAKDVAAWATANGGNPLLRIAVCGYEGEHEFPENWDCYAWKASGGYSGRGGRKSQENSTKERIWFSPHCLKERTLFDD